MNNKITINELHELSDLLIKLGLIGKIIKKLEKHNIDLLEKLINEEDFDKIISDISHDYKVLERKSKKMPRKTKTKKVKIDNRIESEKLEFSLYNKLNGLNKDEIINFVKKEYNHIVPRCSSKKAAIDEAIDVALMSRGFTIKHRPLPFDKTIKTDELKKLLKDRHEFPNRFAFQRLGKKLGITLNGDLSVDQMREKVFNATYGSLDSWYRTIEKM